MRRVIVHYHLFKNAGTSVDNVLKLSLGEERCGSIEGPEGSGVVRPQELLDYILANPKYVCVSSHQASPPLPVHPDLDIFPIVFLRHPLDRARSAYAFVNRQAKDDDRKQEPGWLDSIEDYVKWRLESGDRTITNFQVHHLSGVRALPSEQRRGWTPEDDLDAAKRFIVSLPFVGIVERFYKSMRMLQTWLEGPFPDLKFFVNHANKSRGRAATLEQRMRELKKQLGADLYARLEEENSLDLKLYDFACELFSERYKEMGLGGTTALLDRITRRVHIIKANAESYRFRNANKRAKRKHRPNP